VEERDGDGGREREREVREEDGVGERDGDGGRSDIIARR
jgi:hypothetical protein